MLKKIKNNRIVSYILFVAAVCTIMLIVNIRSSLYNCDNLFMFKHAEILLKDGFIRTDVLRMHEGFDFMMPQWLFALTIYELREIFSDRAITVFIAAVIALIGFVLYHISVTVTSRRRLSLWFSVAVMLLYSICFSQIRPHNVSALLGLCEVLLMEKSLRDGFSWKSYAAAAAISVLQINFHNSMWPLLFLINICYIGELTVRVLVKKDSEAPLKQALIVTLISLAAGFINPYGFEYMIYVIRSMPVMNRLKAMIMEQSPPTGSALRITIFLIATDLFAIVGRLRFRKKPRIRFVLMTLGFAFMAMSAARNLQLLIVFGQFVLLPDRDPATKEHSEVDFRPAVIAAAALSLFIFITAPAKPYYGEEDYQKGVLYLVETGVPKDAKIFCSPDCGSALIYEGYRPYFDCMAELYGIENNHRKDVASELMHALYSQDFRELFDAYGFEYAVVHDDYYADGIKKLPNWECVRDAEGGWVFRNIASGDGG